MPLPPQPASPEFVPHHVHTTEWKRRKFVVCIVYTASAHTCDARVGPGSSTYGSLVKVVLTSVLSICLLLRIIQGRKIEILTDTKEYEGEESENARIARRPADCPEQGKETRTCSPNLNYVIVKSEKTAATGKQNTDREPDTSTQKNQGHRKSKPHKRTKEKKKTRTRGKQKQTQREGPKGENIETQS